ncbi:MAG TPA: hypothetical protein VF304_00805 [Casimicrobiaceae bacterium]
MPGYRLTAWLRPLLTLAAMAGVLSLAACGGGGGSPSQNNSTGNVTLAILPASPTVYSGTPGSLTVSGGRGPYTVFSSDQTVLQVPSTTSGTFAITPGTVSQDTTVQVTVRDAAGAIVTIPVVVKAGLLVNSLTLKADDFNTTDCPNDRIESTSPTDDVGSTWICSGQTGTVGIRIQNANGGGLSGRQIEFDVIQGDFQIFTNAAGTPDTFGLTYTVPTDQNGNAVVRIRANPAASQQLVIVQAKDVTSGNFVRGIFVIYQFLQNGNSQMQIVPNTVTITGPDTLTCSSGVANTFYVFGGKPPYTISNPVPQFLRLGQSIVANSGGGFTLTTLGGCVSPATIAINDSAGHTATVTLNNNVGTAAPSTTTSPIPIVITPSNVPALTCGANTNIVATGGGTITTTGTTQTPNPATSLFVGVDRPDIITALPTTATPGQPITITRLLVGTVSPPDSNALVPVNLFISDGVQTKTIPIQVANTCPPVP